MDKKFKVTFLPIILTLLVSIACSFGQVNQVSDAQENEPAPIFTVSPSKTPLVKPSISPSPTFEPTNTSTFTITPKPYFGSEIITEENITQIVEIFHIVSDRVSKPSWSPDGKVIAGGVGNSVILWSVEGGEELRRLEGHTEDIFSVEFSPDGTLVASGSYDQTVRLWDVMIGEQVYVSSWEGWNRHSCLAFSPDGGLFAFCAAGNMIKFLDTEGFSEIKNSLSHSSPVQSLAFSPDGELFASSIDRFVFLWDNTNGEKIDTFETVIPEYKGSLSKIYAGSLSFSPDGNLLAAAINHSGGGDAGGMYLRFWNLVSGDASVLEDTFFIPYIEFISFQNNETLLVSQVIRSSIWNLNDGINISTFDSLWLALSPDGKTLAIEKEFMNSGILFLGVP